ncbi:MFS transporter [Dactylosporangium fulvum]|uniref:MFS transporter n=1 Tax=Dactylosporangium fulvum TaxID=53359 RepID=A0ABY5VZE5_9ACTN|nr:MFS transporter [Dactylosporangium fulvum]UWP82384.1 MFS transporter [Dactylosporangium fulvum]
MSSKRWVALAVMLLAAYMDLLDATIVTVALPSIQEDFGASGAALQWIAAGYMLAFALVLITGGRLGDIYGRKRMFLLGIAGFTLASAVSGVAPNLALLVTGRLLQGAAAAIMVPQLLTFIQVGFRTEERPRAFGLYGAVLALGGVTGPLVGGSLTDVDLFGWGWRTIFLVNLPVGVLAIVGAAALMVESRAERRPRLDAVGATLVTLGLLALIYPLIQGRELGWPVWSFAVMAAAAPLFGAFWVYESRHRDSALVDPGMLRERSVFAGLTVALVFFASTSFFFVLTLHLQVSLGFDPMRTGLSFVPFAFGVVIGSGAAGRAVPRLGRLIVTLGVLVEAASLLWLAHTVLTRGKDLHAWHLAPPLIGAGVGLALVSATLVTLTLSGVAQDHAGTASGVVNTALQIGSAAGVAMLGAVFFSELSTASGSTHAASVSLCWAAGLAALASPLSLLLPRHAVPEVDATPTVAAT